jgi:NADH-quinone oxidoreductase subunit L
MSKYGFDEFFIWGSVILKKISIFMSTKLDIGIIDSFIVNGVPKKINTLSGFLKNSSTGYLYHYAFCIVLSLVVILGIILARSL